MLVPTIKLPTITQEVALNTIRFNRSLGNLEGRLSQFGRRVSNLGISLSLAISIPFQLATASVIRTFAEIEAAALDAASLMEGGGAGMASTFANLAKNLSFQFPFDPEEILAGVAELERAGFTAAQAWGMIPGMLKNAVANNSELTSSSEQVAGIMTIFGMRSADTTELMKNQAEVLDVLTVAANKTNATFDQMIEGMTVAAPRAKQFGMDIYETAAAIGMYHQNLIKSNKSGTFFSMMMRDITTQFLKNEDVWKETFGIDIFDDTGNLRNTADIIQELEASIGKLTDEGRILALQMLELPSRSLQATLAITGQGKAMKELEEQLRAAGNEVDRMFGIKIQGLGFQLKMLQNQFTAAAAALGSAFRPAVLQVIHVTTNLLYSFSRMNEAKQRSIALWFVLAAAIGPVLLVLGMLISSLQIIISPFGLLIRFVRDAAVALFFLTQAVVLTALAFSLRLVGAILVTVYQLGYYLRWVILLQVHHGLWAGSIMAVRRAIIYLFGAMTLLRLDRFIAQIQATYAAMGLLRMMLMVTGVTAMGNLIARIRIANALYGTMGMMLLFVRTAFIRTGIAAVWAWIAAGGPLVWLGALLVGLGGYLLYLSGVFGWLGEKIVDTWNWVTSGFTSMTESMENEVKELAATIEKEMADVMASMKDTMGGDMFDTRSYEEKMKSLQSQQEILKSMLFNTDGQLLTVEQQKMRGQWEDSLIAIAKKMKDLENSPEGDMYRKELLQSQLFSDYGGPRTLEQKLGLLADALARGTVTDREASDIEQMLRQTAAASEAMAGGTEKFDETATKNEKGVPTHGFSATTYGSEAEYQARVKGQQDAMLKVNQQQLAENKKANTTLVAVNQGIQSLKNGMSSGITLEPVNA